MDVIKRLAFSLALLTAGCASSIGNLSEIDDVEFQLGTTRTSDVANTLGFPESRVLHDGVEYWGYRDRPELTGVIYAFPTGPNTVTTYQATRLSSVPPGLESAAVIYAFDADGLLVDIHQP